MFSFAAGIVYYLFMYPSMTTVRTWLQCSWEASALCSCLSSCASMTQKFRPQEAGTQTPLILFLDFSNQLFVLHTADVIAVLISACDQSDLQLFYCCIEASLFVWLNKASHNQSRLEYCQEPGVRASMCALPSPEMPN